MSTSVKKDHPKINLESGSIMSGPCESCSILLMTFKQLTSDYEKKLNELGQDLICYISSFYAGSDDLSRYTSKSASLWIVLAKNGLECLKSMIDEKSYFSVVAVSNAKIDRIKRLKNQYDVEIKSLDYKICTMDDDCYMCGA